MDDPKKTPPFAQGFGGAKQNDQTLRPGSGQATQTDQTLRQSSGQATQLIGGQPPFAQGFGGAGKELETGSLGSARDEGDQYWENYAREIELEKEIMELGGVEKVESGEVGVPESLAREMGIKPITNIQTPISNVTSFTIKGMSLSDDQLSMGLTKPTSTGIRWLVEWFIYQLLKAHFHIKRIKGKILREKSANSS